MKTPLKPLAIAALSIAMLAPAKARDGHMQQMAESSGYADNCILEESDEFRKFAKLEAAYRGSLSPRTGARYDSLSAESKEFPKWWKRCDYIKPLFQASLKRRTLTGAEWLDALKRRYPDPEKE